MAVELGGETTDMSDFSKTFLLENGRPGSRVFLAAFGKHPGWDDHVEDLGLETQSLIQAKTLLYIQGIGGQTDSGAWEKLDATQVMPVFNHAFLWRRNNQFLIGKMWPSSDGKGRTRYPMILCAHCLNLPLAWGLLTVGPQLEVIQKKCEAADSADDVKSILTAAAADLRNRAASTASQTVTLSPADRRKFVESAELGPEREGLCRILHQVESQMTSYSKREHGTKLRDLRPQQIRLPRGADSVWQSLLLWDQVFQIVLLRAAPVLLVASIDHPWLDATVGEPSKHEFFCLRASDRNIPPASSIPYNFDESIKQEAGKVVAALLSDDATQAAGPPGDSTPSSKGGIGSFFAKALGKLKSNPP